MTSDTAPFLTSLSKERGIVFSEAFTQASWTLPSHASLFTGKNFAHASVSSVLSDTEYTITEALKDTGYQTHAFSTGPFVQPQWGFGQGFDAFTGTVGTEDTWDDLPELFDTALSWIKSREDTSSPYFLFVHSFHVHDPYKGEGATSIIAANKTMDQEVISALEQDYQTEITEFDTAFKHLYESLEKNGTLENTVLIITSDHGEEFGEHGSVGIHGVNTYRETIWVPLIIFLPDGTSYEDTFSVSVSAIPQTIMDILGLGIFSDVPSLLKKTGDRVVISSTSNSKEGILESYAKRDILIKDAAKELTDLEYRIPDIPIPTDGTTVESAIVGRWHLIKNPDGSKELFDMQTDSDEQKNVLSEVPLLAKSEQKKIQTLFNALGL